MKLMRRTAVLCVGIGVLLVSPAPMAQRAGVILMPGRAAGAAGPSSQSMQGALQYFRGRLAAAGEMRLIVEVRMPVALGAQAQGAIDAETESRILRGARDAVVRRLPPQARGVREIDEIPFFAVIADATTFDVLLSDPNVVSIQEDVLRRATLAQSVPLVQANNAWKRGYTGSGITVAVVDTGVAKEHDAFGGRVVSEACYSGGGSTSESVCPNRVLASTAAGSGAPCTPRDECSHGTHVAAIAAGSTGVAKEASIIAIQVFSRDGRDVGAYDSDILKGLNRVYALRNTYEIASVNVSIGGSEEFTETCDSSSRAYTSMINKLYQARIATVVSSGNDGFTEGLSAPACHSKVVSVGSATKGNKISSWSNGANYLRLLAPGASIRAAVPGGGTAVMSGTSMAAPHVAGAWAILVQRAPAMTVPDGLAALQATGLAIRDTRNGLTFRRIRINNALSRLTPLGRATQVAPSGSSASRAPQYSWNKIAGATHYRVWVEPASSGAPVINRWYSSSSVCGATTCAVTPAVTLDAGTTYHWWVQTHEFRHGPWSAGKAFAAPSTVR